MAQPTQQPDWNTGAANRTEPSAGEKTAGFAVNQVPSSAKMNWWMAKVREWTGYAADLAAQAPAGTWAALQTFSAGVAIPSSQTYGYPIADPRLGIMVIPALEFNLRGGSFATDNTTDWYMTGAINAWKKVQVPVGSVITSVRLLVSNGATLGDLRCFLFNLSSTGTTRGAATAYAYSAPAVNQALGWVATTNPVGGALSQNVGAANGFLADLQIRADASTVMKVHAVSIHYSQGQVSATS